MKIKPFYTLGHSTRPVSELIALLQGQQIAALADVRAIPASKYNPHYNEKPLRAALEESGIAYASMKELGGRRPMRANSSNTALAPGFRGYADYMQTTAFEAALEKLIALHAHGTACFMCAEMRPADCHRSLIADALVARGYAVVHILNTCEIVPHALPPYALRRGNVLIYPSPQPELALFPQVD